MCVRNRRSTTTGSVPVQETPLRRRGGAATPAGGGRAPLADPWGAGTAPCDACRGQPHSPTPWKGAWRTGPSVLNPGDVSGRALEGQGLGWGAAGRQAVRTSCDHPGAGASEPLEPARPPGTLLQGRLPALRDGGCQAGPAERESRPGMRGPSAAQMAACAPRPRSGGHVRPDVGPQAGPARPGHPGLSRDGTGHETAEEFTQEKCVRSRLLPFLKRRKFLHVKQVSRRV